MSELGAPPSSSFQAPAPPARPADAHKGTFGTVITVGGAPAMIGAPAIAAHAAQRAGAGLIQLAVEQSILPFALSITPAATGIPLMEAPGPNAAADIASADPRENAALAVGPGMGQREGGAALLPGLWQGPRPVVLDADGLNNLPAPRQLPAPGTLPVLTPHPGEAARLTSRAALSVDPKRENQRLEAARALSEAYGAVVLLKGRNTVITDGARHAINDTGNPAMATAGSGDVLTGVIAALRAAGMPAMDAAVLGARVHGLAGDLWARAHGGSGLTPRELADRVPEAMEALRAELR